MTNEKEYNKIMDENKIFRRFGFDRFWVDCFRSRNVAAATGVMVMDSAVSSPAASINSVAGAVAATETGKDCDYYW